MKSKLIYEKKYPRIHFAKEYKHIKAEAEDEQNTNKLNADQSYKGICVNTQYTPIPQREDTSRDFIREAIGISELYQSNVKITRCIFMVRVCISFDFGLNMEHINRLFGMADRISFFEDESEHDLVACLDLYTHVVVRNGLAVAP